MVNIHINFNRLLLFIVSLILVANYFNIHVFADDNDLKPDLRIVIVKNGEFPINFTEGVEKEFYIRIENIGDKDIESGQNISVGLFFDNKLVISNFSTEGLAIDKSIFINISWAPTYFDNVLHDLKIWVNYNDQIKEKNYDNNYWLTKAIINEPEPDLRITYVDLPDFFEVNKSAVLSVTVENIGKNTTSPVFVSLNSSLDGHIQDVEWKNPINRSESTVFEFNWIPKHFGVHKIIFKVIYKNVTHNVSERSVAVGIYTFKWWNENWHYRYFVTVKGIGNVSHFVNFSGLLDDLGISDQVFENDTLRIIKFSENETVNDTQVYDFNFNVSSGELIWNVGDSPGVKYYYIYFDVENNSGNRTSLPEMENISVSGNASIVSSGFTSGWLPIINSPVDNSYVHKDESIQINVTTTAIAKNVTALIFMADRVITDIPPLNINLDDAGDHLNWVKNISFSKDGNWTIMIKGVDDAGFETINVEQKIYVGNPDLELKNINLKKAVHIDEQVNISAVVFCRYASIKDVNVHLQIIRTSNNTEVYNETKVFNFTKNKDNVINFKWDPVSTGDYRATIIVDFYNNITEFNENNNKKTKDFIVYDWLDLYIKDIKLPKDPVMEFNVVKIDVVIKNDGLIKAENYLIKLYVEKTSHVYMTFSNVIDSKRFTVNASSSVTVSMYWNDTKPGNYSVGFRIYTNDSKRIINDALSDDFLIVKSYEKNKPVISDVIVTPDPQEQGGVVTITANITDDTGIQVVNITITSPNGIETNDVMVRSAGYQFKYEFSETFEVGVYNYEIFVMDISFYENNNTKIGNFSIKRETIEPSIWYVSVDPFVQLKGEEVSIYCIAYDNIGVQRVEVMITPPNGIPFKEYLSEESDNKYVYKDIYSDIGRYTFYILVKDNAENFNISTNRSFWITSDINDTDDDGLPDKWERRYGFNPENASDAKLDPDKDGLTNLEEYQAGTNPVKAIFAQNIGYKIKTNLWYIGLSVLFFIIIVLLAFFGKRRIYV